MRLHLRIAAIFLSGIAFVIPSSILAQCAAAHTVPPSGAVTFELTPLEYQEIELTVDQPGRLVVEAFAPAPAAGRVWLSVRAVTCTSGKSAALRPLVETPARQVFAVMSPGALRVRVASASGSSAQSARIDVSTSFVPASDERPPSVPSKDGEESEEADREIPPLIFPPPMGDSATAIARGRLVPRGGELRDRHALTLDTASRVRIAVAGDHDLDLVLTDAEGRVWEARRLQAADAEVIHLLLRPGRYDLRVEAVDTAVTSYDLIVEQASLR